MLSALSRNFMHCTKILKPLRTVSTSAIRYCKNDDEDREKQLNEVLGSIASKYQVFRNEDASVILDVNEEKYKPVLPTEHKNEEVDMFADLNLERGVSGVFEIDDLVDVLNRENAKNLFVVKLPQEYKYVDYICIVTGRSNRHMLAIAHFVRRVFKKKRKPNDVLPKIEGENSKDWIALDLGNIALHIFSSEARSKYDLDLLWSVGEEYDDESNKPDDPIVRMLEEHSLYLRDLEPAETDTK